jgi:hypothetical protein
MYWDLRSLGFPQVLGHQIVLSWFSEVLADVKSKSVGLATIKSWVKTETPKVFFHVPQRREEPTHGQWLNDGNN